MCMGDIHTDSLNTYFFQHRARVVRVERCVTDDGAFAQRTSYAIDQPGQPTRQFQRTIVIRPADNRRPDDPNLPPSYDMAVTGKDKAVTVEGGTSVTPQPPPPAAAAPSHPPPSSHVPHSQMGSFRSYLHNESSRPPGYSAAPHAVGSSIPTTTPGDDEGVSSSDRTRLLT